MSINAVPSNVETSRKREMRVYVRWMKSSDAAEVLKIEEESFAYPWSEEDFVNCLRQRNCIGMVAEHEDRVAGFTIYELQRNRIHVLNFAVAPDCRRSGVGSQMIAELINMCTRQQRTRILLPVRETNLAAQLFFRENAFRAISVLRSYWEDTSEDAYLMQYKVPF